MKTRALKIPCKVVNGKLAFTDREGATNFVRVNVFVEDSGESANVGIDIVDARGRKYGKKQFYERMPRLLELTQKDMCLAVWCFPAEMDDKPLYLIPLSSVE